MEFAWKAGQAVLARTRWLHGAVLVHGAGLAGVLVVACVLIGAVVAVALVAMTGRENRVAAIGAVAEVLAALLPWRARRRYPGSVGGGQGSRSSCRRRSSRRPR